MTVEGAVEGRCRFVVGRSTEALVLEWAARTDIGHKRTANEDSLVAMPGMLAVADGLGGHAAGDRASAAVVRRLASAARRRARRGGILDDHDPDRALHRASGDILADSGYSRRGSGTTVSGFAVVAREGRPALLVFNIGDSRVYRCEAGRLDQVTVDHSLVQELVEAGRLLPEDAESHPDSNVITRAVGFGGDVVPDRWVLRPSSGVRLLVCTDGLTREVGVDRIAQLLAGGTPAAAADALVAAALDAGGRDNVTVIVVDVVESPVPAPVVAPGTATTRLPRASA